MQAAPRTRKSVTPLSDHVVATDSGKEILLVTRASFCRFPAPCEWFSCLLRDKYKKVSDTTVCTSSKSFDKKKPPVTCRLTLLTHRHEASGVLSACSLLLLLVPGQPAQEQEHFVAEEKAAGGLQAAQLGQTGTSGES